MRFHDEYRETTVKYMTCSLPLLRSSKKQIAVVLVLGVFPQFTRQGKANRMEFCEPEFELTKEIRIKGNEI